MNAFRLTIRGYAKPDGWRLCALLDGEPLVISEAVYPDSPTCRLHAGEFEDAVMRTLTEAGFDIEILAEHWRDADGNPLATTIPNQGEPPCPPSTN